MDSSISLRLRSRDVDEKNAKVTNNEDKRKTAESDTNIRPAKRAARLMTEVRGENTNSTATKTQEQPAKRTYRRAITVDGRNENGNMPVANTRKKRNQNEMMSLGEKFDAMSALVKTNCQLTNELVMTKKQLYESMNECLKTQEKLHQVEVAHMELVSMNEEMAKTIDRMKSELFCNDLIDLECVVVQTAGEFLYFKYKNETKKIY